MKVFVSGVNKETNNIGYQLLNLIDSDGPTIDPVEFKRGDEFPEEVRQQTVGFVCCLGYLDVKKFKDKEAGDIFREINSNFSSPVMQTLKFMNAYPKHRKKIILIGSMAYKKALTGHSVYGAAKAALVSFARHLSYEEAKGGLTKIWVIAPGSVEETPMIDKLVYETAKMKQKEEAEVRRDMLTSFPDGKPVSVRSIAYAITFCLSGYADQMSGCCFEMGNNQR